MSPKFGTSGLRGLVTELTEPFIKSYVSAFIRACKIDAPVYIGWDLRPSSLQIADWVSASCRENGIDYAMLGALPTPALALAAQRDGAAAIMITGSHIPADRNGVKFYTTAGEISKDNEAAILAALQEKTAITSFTGRSLTPPDALDTYHDRYVDAFGSTALKGLRIGVYTHSTVGRDILMQIVSSCGGDVVELGRSDIFIPVDTEAVDETTRNQLCAWIKEFDLDCIISLDGDADRPMLSDETGRVIPGDILGQITAQSLGATCVVTPISSNTGIAHIGDIPTVIYTKIGSPYVVSAIEQAISDGERKVVGYEANGGFLLGFEAKAPVGSLSSLLTRDAILPIIATLTSARGSALSHRVEQEPQRFTSTDRLQDCDETNMEAFIASLRADISVREALLHSLGQKEVGIDETDGVRMVCESGTIVHIRPSGNAPELRVYIESTDAEFAKSLREKTLAHLKEQL